MKKNRWQDWLNMLLGAWLFASPWLLKYADDLPRAAWSAWISGAAIVLFAAFALYIPKAAEEIVNALLGVWVAVSPWVLGFAANRDVTTNAIFVGVLVALLAIWAAEFGHKVGKWHNHNRHPA
jgi:hypothetical protein